MTGGGRCRGYMKHKRSLGGPGFDLPVCRSGVVRVAQRPHVCCECRTWIEPGERYERSYEGAPNAERWTERTCMVCAQTHNDFCRSWIRGRLRVVLWDALGADYVTGEDDEEPLGSWRLML